MVPSDLTVTLINGPNYPTARLGCERIVFSFKTYVPKLSNKLLNVLVPHSVLADRQRDRQTDRQAGRQAGIEALRQTHR